MKKKEERIWRIKRYVVEYYQIEATSRKEAIEKNLEYGDPYDIKIVRVSAKRGTY